jgi:hypothetical protein
MTDGSEGGDRGLAHEWVAMVKTELGESPDDRGIVGLLFAGGEGRHLDDGRIVVVERSEERHTGVASGELRGAPPDGRSGISKGDVERGITEMAEALQRAEGARPHGGIFVVDGSARRVEIAVMSSDDDLAVARRRHFTMLSMSTNVPTIRPAATTAKTAPRTTASTPAPTRESNRCHHGGRW